jgi:hypothetical protein
MNNLIKIYDHATGEEIEREMTAEEQAVRDKEVSDWLEAKAIKDAEKEKTMTDKNALLTKLGISSDEAKLLLN